MFPLILSLNNINQEKVAISFSSLSPGKQTAASHSGFARFNSNLNFEVIFSKIKGSPTYAKITNPSPTYTVLAYVRTRGFLLVESLEDSHLQDFANVKS